MKPIVKDFKYSLRVFFGSIFIGIFILVGLFIFQYRTVFSSVAEISSSDINAYKSHINDRITDIASDVFLIEELIENRNAFELSNGTLKYQSELDKTIMENDLLDWIDNNTVFDQIRVLDNNGFEVLRVNKNNGEPFIIPSNELQDKSSRYYFQNAIELEDNVLYLSKIDLNIENGEIEYIDGKAKQMLRLATTFYDEDGNKLGLIIINYLVQNLFHDHETDESYFTSFEVINKDGYYLHAKDDDIEFGFMFDERLDEVYSKYHDYDIFSNSTIEISQNEFDNELYISYILDENQIKNTINDKLNDDIEVYFDNGDIIIFGEIILQSTPEFIQLRITYILIFIVYCLIVLFFTKLLDEVHFERKERFRYLEFSSNHDLLTGLPNRKNVYDMIDYLSKRKKQFSVLFLDLDDFKQINDNYGHQVGDLVLVEISKRMTKSVRKNDIVARLGGDEFVIVLIELVDEKVINQVINLIKNNMNEIMNIDGKKCKVDVSVGFSIQDSTKTVDELVYESDSRMYEEKKQNKKTES